jgi:hypothetical protein
MKVVINRCFGGFGLSKYAFELLLQRKGVEYETRPAKFAIGDHDVDYYHKGHLDEDEHFISGYEFYENRSDDDLVAVVEEMGVAADGWCSELAVVEIPDDVKWHIHEYDGMEHVAEDHRTWS